jgi:uncharacterized protein (TIGR01777 family)
MAEYTHKSELPVPAEELFNWHARPGAFQRLAPPWQEIALVEHEGIRDGERAVIDMKVGPLTVRWVARHGDYEPGRRFRDEAEQGPFQTWVHTHSFLPADGGSVLEDRIVYEPPLGALGALARPQIEGQLRAMFRFRHRRTREDLARHALYADKPRLKVAITGGSGLVGQALTAFLTTGGHEVIQLVRGPSRGPGEARWSTEQGLLEPEKLAGVDAVVHLAGKSIGDGPWTPAVKAEIVRSRDQGTRALCASLAAMEAPPPVLVSASAIGYYGDRGAEALTEDSAPGEGFLAEVCQAWEAACEPAVEAGIRVVNPRIGVVLTAGGGALTEMLTPFKLGVGGPMGGGDQFMSWVSLDDLLGMVLHLIYTDGLSGPVNAVSPTPVPQRVLARVLGRVLRRPAVMPAPAAALKLVLGSEMAREMVLAGAKVLPSRLQSSGFRFFYPDLEDCLRMELGKLPG